MLPQASLIVNSKIMVNAHLDGIARNCCLAAPSKLIFSSDEQRLRFWRS